MPGRACGSEQVLFFVGPAKTYKDYRSKVYAVLTFLSKDEISFS